MINWKPRVPASEMEEGKTYLVTDGNKISLGRCAFPYSDGREIWYNDSNMQYVHFEFTHYAEVNFPERN